MSRQPRRQRESQQERLQAAQRELVQRVRDDNWEAICAATVTAWRWPRGRWRQLRPVLIVDGHYACRNIGFPGALDYGKLVALLEAALAPPPGMAADQPLVRYYLNSHTESLEVERQLEAHQYKVRLRGTLVDDRGKLKQDGVDSSITSVMFNVVRPPDKHPEGVSCNLILVLGGDQDLVRGLEMLRTDRAGLHRDLAAGVLGFKHNVSYRWRQQAAVFHLEDLDVWNGTEVRVQYDQMVALQEKLAAYYRGSVGPASEELQQFQKSQASPAMMLCSNLAKEFLAQLEANRVVVVTGDTGCGKSTQFPKFVMQASKNHRVVVTQSRRLAARSLARRVQLEANTRGGQVAYQIRGQDHVETDCQLVYCTTGVLLRQLQGGGKLRDYTHVFVDEVHERTYEADLLLAILKAALPFLPDLKVVVMSATISAEKFLEYFNTFPHWLFPINIPRSFQRHDFLLEQAFEELQDAIRRGQYRPEHPLPRRDAVLKSVDPGTELDAAHSLGDLYLAEDDPSLFPEVRRRFATELLRFLHHTRPLEEAVLVFLPGLREIQVFRDYLRQFDNVELCILHSEAKDAEGSVFDNGTTDVRRIILSTDIAENAVTLPAVHVVVDFCLQKALRWGAEEGRASLDLVRVSRDAAVQRAGRTGRVRDGRCYRLLTEAEFATLSDFRVPAIQCMPLATALLEVLHMNLPWVLQPMDLLASMLDPPPYLVVGDALKLLVQMECIEEIQVDGATHFRPTPRGHVLKQLPLQLEHGLLVLFGCAVDCVVPAVVAAAVLENRRLPFAAARGQDGQERTVEWLRSVRGFAQGWPSDLIAAVNAFRGWKQQQQQQLDDTAPMATMEQVDWNDANSISADWMLEIDSTVQSVLRALSLLALYQQRSSHQQQLDLGAPVGESHSLLVLLLAAAALAPNLLEARPVAESNFLHLPGRCCRTAEDRACTLEYRGPQMDRAALEAHLKGQLGADAVVWTRVAGGHVYVRFQDEATALLAANLASHDGRGSALYAEAQQHWGRQGRAVPLFSLTTTVQLDRRSVLAPLRVPEGRAAGSLLLAGRLQALQRHRSLHATILSELPRPLVALVLQVFHPQGEVSRPGHWCLEQDLGLDDRLQQPLAELQAAVRRCINGLDQERLATIAGAGRACGASSDAASLETQGADNRRQLLEMVVRFIEGHADKSSFGPYAAKAPLIRGERPPASRNPACDDDFAPLPSSAPKPATACPAPLAPAPAPWPFPAFDFSAAWEDFRGVRAEPGAPNPGLSRIQMIALAALAARREPQEPRGP